MLYNGSVKKHVESFGTPCMIMVGLSGNGLPNLEKALDIAYQGVLDDLDSIWGVKGLIVTHSNLVVMWKVKPQMGIIS